MVIYNFDNYLMCLYFLSCYIEYKYETPFDYADMAHYWGVPLASSLRVGLSIAC